MLLRTTVLMKTDIASSTPRFRSLSAEDLQALLIEHRALVARHAADHGGQIVRPAGDGYWLEYPSVTAAAKSAVAMQEALRLAQPTIGDDRLSMRVVIGLGDIAVQEGDLIGELLALIVRIEAITPADEIYLTSAARLALKQADVQTGLVDSFALKGFAELIPVYRIEQRHRMHFIADSYILYSDLREFVQFTESASLIEIEHLLDTLETLTHKVAQEFGGTIRFIDGDACCLTFIEPSEVIAAAERLSQAWEAARREKQFRCAINVAVHRGQISIYRSFLLGRGTGAAKRILATAHEVLAAGEGGVFVTSAMRDSLSSSPWHNQLHPVAITLPDARFSGLAVYRLDGAPRGQLDSPTTTTDRHVPDNGG